MEVELNTGDKVAFETCLANHAGAWLRGQAPSLGEARLTMHSPLSSLSLTHAFPVELVAFPGSLSKRLTAWLNHADNSGLKAQRQDRHTLVGTRMVNELVDPDIRVVAEQELVSPGWLKAYAVPGETGRAYFVDIEARLAYCPDSCALRGVVPDTGSATVCALVRRMHALVPDADGRGPPMECLHVVNTLEALCLDEIIAGRQMDVRLSDDMGLLDVAAVVREALAYGKPG